MADVRLSVALPAAASAVALAIVASIVPDIPPPFILGGDAPAYESMANDPFAASVGSPSAQRVAAPFIAWLLPFTTATSFLVESVVAIVLASVFVALICRHFGLSLGHQTAAAALTAGSYVGVHGVFNQYYVDPETLAMAALVLLLAFQRREILFAVALAFAVPFKEILVTLVVLPYVLWRPDGVLWDRRLLVRTLLLAAPALAMFAIVHTLAPVLEGEGPDQRLLFSERFDPDAGLKRGFLTAVANPFVALLGATWLLWPLGLLRGPRDLRRAHIWVALAFPILAIGAWERTMGVFVPIALVTALWVLRRASPTVLAVFAVGSFWVSGIAGAITIGDDGTTAAFKGALIAPGLAVAWGALAWELRRRWKLGELPSLRRPAVRAGRA